MKTLCLVGLSGLSVACGTDDRTNASAERPNETRVTGVYGYPDRQAPVTYNTAFWWELRPSAILVVLAKDAADCAAATPDPNIEASADRLSVTMVERWRMNDSAVWQVRGVRVYPSYAKELSGYSFPVLPSKAPLKGALTFDYHGKEDASFKLGGSFVATPCGKAPPPENPARPQRDVIVMVNGVRVPINDAILDSGSTIYLSTDPLGCSRTWAGDATLVLEHSVSTSTLRAYGDRLPSSSEASGKKVSGLTLSESGNSSVEIDWDVTTEEGLHIEAKGTVKVLECSHGSPAERRPPPPPPEPEVSPPATSNAPAAGSAPKVH